MRKQYIRIVQLALFAATAAHAVNPQYVEMYRAMEEEQRALANRMKAFKDLMDENAAYEQTLQERQEENKRHIAEIVSLKTALTNTAEALSTAEHELVLAEGRYNAKQKELDQTIAQHEATKAELRSTQNRLDAAQADAAAKQKTIEKRDQVIQKISQERQALERQLAEHQGMFKTTLQNIAAALGFESTFGTPAEQKIQTEIYRLKRQEVNLSEANKVMQDQIKKNTASIQNLEDNCKTLQQNVKKQENTLNKNHVEIQHLKEERTQLAQDVAQQTERAKQAEEKNLMLGVELYNACERVDTLKNALEIEKNNAAQFKNDTKDALNALTKTHAQILADALNQSKSAADETFAKLFNKDDKPANAPAPESPKTVKKSALFSLFGFFKF